MVITDKKCLPCEGFGAAMDKQTAMAMMSEVKGWSLNDAGTEISRDIEFKNYYQTIAFVNAIAWLAHQENHHPNLEVGYNHCLIKYTTHALQGLSENDFICAAKVNLLHPSVS
ncbi:MAG: pterin-4-alpha-carbinolamine dehydratase [Gammaproteobacteria bacterium]|jgi:4a-hydroxytetrahydrobiopterin dehydratase|nr:pterin-4-alpha-carbinolamine dehydratase [Gammaproteobacteria bacterium]